MRANYGASRNSRSAAALPDSDRAGLDAARIRAPAFHQMDSQPRIWATTPVCRFPPGNIKLADCQRSAIPDCKMVHFMIVSRYTRINLRSISCRCGNSRRNQTRPQFVISLKQVGVYKPGAVFCLHLTGIAAGFQHPAQQPGDDGAPPGAGYSGKKRRYPA